MIAFLERVIGQKNKVRESHLATYQRIVRILASGSDLNRADAAAAEAAIDHLNLAPSNVESDVAALKQAAELEPVAATVEAARAASKAASVAITEAEVAYPKKFKALQAEMEAVMAKRKNSLAAFAAASRAAETLVQLRRDHPRVWGPASKNA
jgi:hypothetical protein